MNRQTLSMCGVLCTAVVAGYMATPSQASLSTGCDITVSRLGMSSSGSGDDFGYYGTSAGKRAFSIATTSCNAGTTTCDWIDTHSGASAGKHPTIFGQAYRLLIDNDTGASRFEQIGMSWGKHSFCAVSEPTCAAMVNGSCSSTSCSTLGVGCADTYWADLNATQSDLGPRAQINPWHVLNQASHATYNTPSTAEPSNIRGRLQIKDSDINYNMSLGAPNGGQWDTEQNFAEVIYIDGADEEYENRHNNGSYREVNLSLTNMSGVGTGPSTVNFMEYAITAWRDHAPNVGVKTVTVPDNGRYHVGWNVTEVAENDWLYEYMVFNANASIEGTSFLVPAQPGTTVTGDGFHSPFYHSGDGVFPNSQSNTPWAHSYTEGGAVAWNMVSEGSLSNELGFATGYNFRFHANAPPQFGVAIEIGLENSTSISLNAIGPGEPATGALCIGDTDDNGVVDVDDLVNVIVDWGTDGSANGGDVSDGTGSGPADGIVDVGDIVAVITNWGDCP